jgi:uncharacterized protein YbjT (DUF2867 family)
MHSQQLLRHTYKAITATTATITATTTNHFNRPAHIRTFTTTATMSKILTVFGATGIQGGSVINSVLASSTLSKTFKIRGITRDPSKPSGQALAAKGVEPIKADMNDKVSLQAAIKGSYAVFAVTNFWETRSEEIEVKQGKNMADACLAEGVQHLVWSTLPYVTKLTKGQYTHVDHFDGKAKITEYIENIKGDKMTTTYFMPGFYATNVKSNIRPGPDGVPMLSLPWNFEKTMVPAFSPADDTGKFVSGILSREPASVNGIYIHAVSEWITPAKMLEVVSKAAGKEVKFNELSDEAYLKMLPPPLALELGETMFLIRDYSYYGLGEEKNQSRSNAILEDGVRPTSWQEFVESQKPWEV